MTGATIGSAELTRRSLLASVAMAGSAPLLAVSAYPAMAKISAASVAYQDTPKNNQTCADCALFEPPSSCKTVDGVISPKGWCRIWAKKRS